MAVAATMSLIYSATYAVLAYVIPGYQTFKAVEKKSTESVRDWGMYWTVFCALYCAEWLLDAVLCWLPFYYAAKLFFIYSLWSPSFGMARNLYVKAISPILGSYEADIDKGVIELRTRVADICGQQTEQIKRYAKDFSGKATVALKNVQQKAMEKAKTAGGPTAGATQGMHTE